MGGARGVVWDLGNVLIDWDPWAAVAAGVGQDEARRFRAAEDFDFLAFNHGPDSGQPWEEAEAAAIASHPHWARHVLAYREHFTRSMLGEVPGTVALVRELHDAGVPMWGLTNWSHELWPHAPRLFDFLSLLDDVIVSGTEGVAKPDPRIFEIVHRRTGRELADLVLVDDRDANVAAAVEAGMQAVLFTDADRLRHDLHALGLPV